MKSNMKTLVATCACFALLAGGYLAIAKLREVKPFTIALLADHPLTTNRQSRIDSETSLAPVQTLPGQITASANVEEEIDWATTNSLSDSNWIDLPRLQKEMANAARAFSQAFEPAEPVEIEEAAGAQLVPFMQDDLKEIESAMEVRRLIMNLDPTKMDSGEFSEPAQVSSEYPAVATAYRAVK